MTAHLTGFATRRLQGALESGRILRYMIAAIVAATLVVGVIEWIVDRHDFPTLGLALWWSVTTVTTVGYGDVVPVQPLGRLVASLLMITGFASLSLLTGIVASLMVAKRTAETTITRPDLDKLDRRLAEIELLLGGRGDRPDAGGPAAESPPQRA